MGPSRFWDSLEKQFDGIRMKTSHKDLISLIDLCRLDEHFKSLVSPMFAWRDWVVREGFQDHTIKLMDVLQEDYSEVFERSWGTPNSHRSVSPFDLARWLCNKANNVGAKISLKLFLDFIENPVAPLYVISLVEGVIPDETYYFDESTYLCTFEGLPKGVSERMNFCWRSESRDFNGEIPTYIVTRVECNVLNFSNYKGTESVTQDQLFEISQSHLLKSYFLSLFTRNVAACIKKDWCVFEESTPCSGFIDSNETTFLQVVRPFYSESLQLSDKLCLQILLEKFKGLPEATQNSIELALKRKTSAMNVNDPVDAAIDLGMCAESILTKSESSEQISLQVRLLGARLSSDVYKERVQHYNQLKAFYSIRSDAVHNAKVKDEYKVRDIGKIAPILILNDTSKILSLCVLKIIELGGLSDFDKELVLLR